MKRVAIPARGFPVGLLCGLAIVTGACSGVSDPGALGNPGMAPADAGIDQTATVGGDASTVAETSTPVDTGAATDAPEAAVADAAPDVAVVDAGGGVVDAGATFACGATDTCRYGTETCCVQTAAGQVTQMCATGIMAASCPGGSSAALRCVATPDCPTGDVCCLNTNAASGLPTAQCRVGQQCPATLAQLCSGPDPATANPTCPMPTAMNPNVTGVCRAPGLGGGGVPRLPAGVGVCQ
jgi:hypothetical protein